MTTKLKLKLVRPGHHGAMFVLPVADAAPRALTRSRYPLPRPTGAKAVIPTRGAYVCLTVCE